MRQAFSRTAPVCWMLPLLTAAHLTPSCGDPSVAAARRQALLPPRPGPSVGVTGAPRVRQERQCDAEAAALVAVASGPRSCQRSCGRLWNRSEAASVELCAGLMCLVCACELPCWCSTWGCLVGFAVR